MSRKKRIFILKNINVDEVDKKYDIKLISNITNANECMPKNATKLTELAEKNNSDIISFLDESKRLHKCFITMIDIFSKRKINDISSNSSYSCYWCRNKIDSKPIGCPVSYKPRIIQKKYDSEISKETYTIRENISSNRIKSVELPSSVTPQNESSYYETFGIFCSFNCIMAYVIDNKHNRLFDSSKVLLHKLYYEIMNIKYDEPIAIKPSPSWKLLTEYGGPLTIKEYREGLNKIEYEHHGITRILPEFNPIGELFESKVKF